MKLGWFKRTRAAPKQGRLSRFWNDHSLSITATGLGGIIMASSIPLKEGWVFDLVSQIGGSLFGAGLVNFMAGPLREKNKPEL